MNTFEHKGFFYSYVPMEGGELVSLQTMLELMQVPNLLRVGKHATSHMANGKMATIHSRSGVILMADKARYALLRRKSTQLWIAAVNSPYLAPPRGWRLPTRQEVESWLARGSPCPNDLVWIATELTYAPEMRRVFDVKQGLEFWQNSRLRACRLYKEEL